MTYGKKELRRAYIARMRQLDIKNKVKEQEQLASRLYDQPEWVSAKTVALTMSQSFEVDTGPIILHARHKGQRVVVPRTLPNRQMEFVELNEETQFKETSFGLLEPENGTVVTPDQIDFMLVPGVAFKENGQRLGFGGGYYDRYLAKYNGFTCSLVLTTQLADDDEWEPDQFDIPVDRIITIMGNGEKHD
ncbi:5-formyltetrahydrofolate cyclo-ligase [Limosilactobacillus secaliphilus]|uniref:5-formyltetrahydrofolate cyclo-ligase n=1 Tax=Limosilactobacillus secaliphilus TaxID=396268 RepID=A0A0R2I1T5_9LACO|nr:5-formyltetrahydrofolate cyclo-ligase [Limosilactobacillus secaliphilus]KRN59136.1 5-formyltetrahydrofolate cyclo-ligase [Limosilactobacillus secaliphilus]